MTRLIGTVKGVPLKNWEGKTEWDTALDTEVLFAEYERILKRTGAAVIFSQEPYTHYIRSNIRYNFRFAHSAIWLKNRFANNLLCNKAPVSYFEDISTYRKYRAFDDEELREYFTKVIDFIGLPVSQIRERLGRNRADHVFRVKSVQFELCRRGCIS